MELTRQQIEQMPAGREMDGRIAMALGYRYAPFSIFEGEDLGPVERRPDRSWEALPLYSTDIAAAWQVVEALDKTARLCDITRINGGATYLHHCEVWNTSGDAYHRATADAAPLAICRAALLATLPTPTASPDAEAPGK